MKRMPKARSHFLAPNKYQQMTLTPVKGETSINKRDAKEELELVVTSKEDKHITLTHLLKERLQLMKRIPNMTRSLL